MSSRPTLTTAAGERNRVFLGVPDAPEKMASSARAKWGATWANIAGDKGEAILTLYRSSSTADILVIGPNGKLLDRGNGLVWSRLESLLPKR